MKKMLLTCCCFSVIWLTNAQNLSFHYPYLMNWYNVNPGATGAGIKGSEYMINSLTKIAGVTNNPTSTMFGMHSFTKDRMGLGARIGTDRRGYFSNLSAEMRYAYQVKFGKEEIISFGVSVGFFQSSFDLTKALENEYNDVLDSKLLNNNYNKTMAMSGFGVYYIFKNWHLGASIPHFIMGNSPLQSHMYFLAKHKIEPKSTKMAYEPLATIQIIPENKALLDFGTKLIWSDIIETQVLYRTNNSFFFGAGVKVRHFSVGYLYNLPVGIFSHLSNGSHEIVLKLNRKNTGFF